MIIVKGDKVSVLSLKFGVRKHSSVMRVKQSSDYTFLFW